MLKQLIPAATALLVVSLAASNVRAEGASSWVDVGPGHANAGASYDAPLGIAQSESRVGDVNMGRGLAIGFGPNGFTLSHSIGVQDNGVAFGHNVQLSIGPNGTHVSHGGVVTAGGNSQVITGGETQIDRFGARGGNYAGGSGWQTQAWSESRTQPGPLARFRARRHPWHP